MDNLIPADAPKICVVRFAHGLSGPRLMIVLLLLAGLCVTSCSDSSSDSDDDDQIVGGVNVTRLFAPPTSAEKDLVLADWAARAIDPVSVTTVSSASVSLGGTTAAVRIVSHLVGGFIHYGAVISPNTAETLSTPVIVYSHGGDAGVSVDEVLSALPLALGSAQDDFVYVIPSFRSETLRYNGVTYTSGGEPSPWDYDVDDALSLVEAALDLVPGADSARLGVVGFSRGACVGMLMGIRDPSIDLVVEFFGPTDFFGPFVQEVVEEALAGTPRDLPGLDDLNDQVIQPLKSGALSYSEARLEMLRRSPVHFVELLPPTQAHHGTADDVVSVGEAGRLEAVFLARDLGPPDYQVYYYTGRGHTFVLPGAFERVQTFLMRLTAPAVASVIGPSVD